LNVTKHGIFIYKSYIVFATIPNILFNSLIEVFAKIKVQINCGTKFICTFQIKSTTFRKTNFYSKLVFKIKKRIYLKMQFEWDPIKGEQNYKKHKIHFEEAATVFYDNFSATFDDPDHSINELRLITVGYSSQGRLLVISHTERDENIRIISARIATTSERKRHEN